MDTTNGADGAKVQGDTRINLEQSRKLAKELLKAFKAGDRRALDRIRWGHPRFRGLSDDEIKLREFVLADAQLVIARSHHTESWPKLLQLIESMEHSDPLVKRFEDAADAIISGNLPLLRSMVSAYPPLVQERSSRAHRSTLLHYISANGVEDYRQITPNNIVDIARFLLDAGAEVDAESNAYGGGSTTLGLTATSAHPRLAGVQLQLIDLLIDRGAANGPIEHGTTIPHGCLANGCPEAAVHLVLRGANPDNLFGAAALGRLDVVQQLFASARPAHREAAMMIAAQCDHADVVGFLLGSGVHAAAYYDGMTALHWASSNGSLALMDRLIALGAPLEAQNEFGGTVLSSTLWFAYHALPADFSRRDYPAVFDKLIAAGADTAFYPEMLQEIEGVYKRANRS